MTAAREITLHDPAEVSRALELIVPRGDVVELRVLGGIVLGDRRPLTLSGYFDDPDKLLAAIETVVSAQGFYLTLNKIDPALLARAMNKLRPVGKGATTNDADVIRRRWLLVDVDAERPAGIASTDDEHDAAINLASRIRAELSAEGWPEPILADSGNGAHLLYRIDLPAGDGGLVARCLDSLGKRFDADGLHVDRKVFNPARISKLYGTMSGKGDADASTIGRPQRMARIIDAP
jgi:hypothetical protein